jgi:dTDP-4-dehydrorhamnose 3,5-epimerase
MPLVFSEAHNISGLTLIIPHHINDERGVFCKYFEKEVFKENGIVADFSESNVIKSGKKGTLRGLHYQNSPSQDRLLYVIAGSIFYVTLDLREGGSDTFGKYEYFYLSEDQPKAIYSPGNFAYGLLSLADNTIVSYQSDGRYMPENCGGILWNDSTLNIPWPIETLNAPLIISEKDRNWATFEQHNTVAK